VLCAEIERKDAYGNGLDLFLKRVYRTISLEAARSKRGNPILKIWNLTEDQHVFICQRKHTADAKGIFAPLIDGRILAGCQIETPNAHSKERKTAQGIAAPPSLFLPMNRSGKEK
jgi:hypothetical protein